MNQRIWIVCYHRKNRPKIEVSVCQRCRYHRTCHEFKNAIERHQLHNPSLVLTGQR